MTMGYGVSHWGVVVVLASRLVGSGEAVVVVGLPFAVAVLVVVGVAAVLWGCGRVHNRTWGGRGRW